MQPVNDSSHIKAHIKAAIHGFWHFLFTFKYLCILLITPTQSRPHSPNIMFFAILHSPRGIMQLSCLSIWCDKQMWCASDSSDESCPAFWQHWQHVCILTAPCRRVIICNRPMSSHVTVHDTPIRSNCNNCISIGNWYQELYYFLFKVQCWGWICLTSGFVQTAGGTFCKMADCHLPKATNSKQFLKNYIWFYVHIVVAFNIWQVYFSLFWCYSYSHCYCHPLPTIWFNFFLLTNHKLAAIDLICCDPLTITTTISVFNHEMGRLSTIVNTIYYSLLTRLRQVLSRKHSVDPMLILWLTHPPTQPALGCSPSFCCLGILR